MTKQGKPIMILMADDDREDCMLAKEALVESRLANDLRFVYDGEELMDYLRYTFSPESKVTYDRVFEEVKNAPLLILDDLGTESATPWAQEKLSQLLGHRYVAASPTVVTETPPTVPPAASCLCPIAGHLCDST